MGKHEEVSEHTVQRLVQTVELLAHAVNGLMKTVHTTTESVVLLSKELNRMSKQSEALTAAVGAATGMMQSLVTECRTLAQAVKDSNNADPDLSAAAANAVTNISAAVQSAGAALNEIEGVDVETPEPVETPPTDGTSDTPASSGSATGDPSSNG